MNRVETLSNENKIVASVGGSVLFEKYCLSRSLKDISLLLRGKDINPVKYDSVLVYGLIGICNELIEDKKSTFLIVGGGNIARWRIEDARSYGNPKSDEQLDLVGKDTSETNASELLAIFERMGVKASWNSRHKWGIRRAVGVYIRGGTEPCQTTDMVSMQVAVAEGAKFVVNVSNTPGVHPVSKNGGLKTSDIIESMSYDDYLSMFDLGHRPGKNSPFETQAAKLAKENGITTILVGNDLENLNKLIHGEEFVGTVLSK